MAMAVEVAIVRLVTIFTLSLRTLDHNHRPGAEALHQSLFSLRSWLPPSRATPPCKVGALDPHPRRPRGCQLGRAHERQHPLAKLLEPCQAFRKDEHDPLGPGYRADAVKNLRALCI
jgi:hypothetical protein